MVHSGMHIGVAMGYRIQGADARRVSNAEGVPRIVRKHDCALPAQYTKHSNARGVSLGLGPWGWIRLSWGAAGTGSQLGIRVTVRGQGRVTAGDWSCFGGSVRSSLTGGGL